jgi:hypothetical protein
MFALMNLAPKYNIEITEFTIAHPVNPVDGGFTYYEWFVDFESLSKHMNALVTEVYIALLQNNIYYKYLINGSVLSTLLMFILPQN